MIETHDLTKKYGDHFAIKGLEINLEKGDVFGFIGPNGAGKTTTMRILATLLNPTWGEAYVGGYSIYTRPREIRRMIGYMPDFFGVYDDMKVIEYLEFFAAAYRIQGPARRKVANEMLELVELGYKRDALVTSLSRGMTQRLGLARVLLHDPQVLLLDEPASGLDPRARIEIRGLLKRLRAMGKTIMVSSHILPELADICNKIGIIELGVLEVNEAVTEVLKRLRPQTILNIAVAGDLAAAARLLEGHPMVQHITERDQMLLVTLVKRDVDYSELATLLIQGGHKLTLLKEDELNLETAFMALTKGITS
ncbi:MAG TPA: ABC transporter ATP-binding protein [Pirellulales bacterium]|nr:ABC transporter ATP-binding protein [Pirellulales bacterium]